MMSLAPLLAAPFAVQLHVFTVVPAFFLGAWLIFFSRKGARRHRAIGYAYLGLMTVTAIAALFIHQIPSIDIVFGFGPIHLFSLLTLSGVVGRCAAPGAMMSGCTAAPCRGSISAGS